MNQPLVSIIIPVYNSEKHLAETISSALAQTWPYTEIIIVDDGSNDNSLAIAKSFTAENIRVVHQQNKGASAARNKGIQEAAGNYIQFLDADDLLSPDKIALQVQSLDKKPGKIAVCGTIHFQASSPPELGKRTRDEEAFLYNNDDPVHFLINLLGGFRESGSMVTIHAWLTPRLIIDNAGYWNEELTVDDDGEFFSRVILNSNGIIKTNGISYYRKYRNLNESLSSLKSEEAQLSGFKSALLKKEHLFAHNNSDAAQKAIFKQLLNLAVKSYLRYPSIYKQIKKELKKYPDYHFTPVLGGKSINTVAKILGWRTARRMQYYYLKWF